MKAHESGVGLAVGEPEGDIGNIETVLEALTDACYYLNVEKTRYKFSLKENLNKRFSDRRATIQKAQIDEEVKGGIQKLFPSKEFSERVFFPEKSMQISDRPVVTFAISGLDHTMRRGEIDARFCRANCSRVRHKLSNF